MKQLILQPPILIGILTCGTIYFGVLFNLTRNKKIALLLENIAECIFLVIISGANFFPLDRLNPGDIGDPEKSLPSAILLLIVYGMFFIVFRGTKKQLLDNFLALFKQPVLGLYLGIMIFSVFWSENPRATLQATFGLLFFSIFVVHLARKYQWVDLCKLLRWNTIILAIFSVYTALFVPSIGITPKGWCGGFGHPIGLGNMMALGISLWLLNAFANPKYRLRSLGLSILCLIVLINTNSAGAWVLLFVLVVALIATTFMRFLKFSLAFSSFVVMLFLFGSATFWLISNIDNLLFFLNKDITMSGRVPLWTILIQKSIPERPWFGYGYQGFWQRWRGDNSPAIDVVNYIMGGGRDWVAHSHNGFLEIILNLGLVGLLIFIVLFLINTIKTIKLIIANKHPESFLPLIILMYVFITNIYNPPIVGPGYCWFVFLLITIRLNLIPPKMHKLKTKNSLI